VARLRVRLVWLVVASLVCLALLACSACGRDPVPPLVEATDVTPREIELGDRLEVKGVGFPQRRTARLTFRGDLHRPGEPAARGVTIDAVAQVESVDRLDLAVTDALEERFCGEGERASHTTFRGELDVAFASSAPGAPPLVGTMRGVVLDVRPSSVGSAVVDARNAEGARVLAFLGITPGVASARGLAVEAVAPGSPAERARIAAGDVLVESSGVHVFAAADLAPPSARALEILVRRADSGVEDTVTVPLAGFTASRIPPEYAPAMIVVGLALAWLLLLVLPTPASLGAVELRAAAMLRRAKPLALARALFGRGAGGLVSLLASVLVGTFALGPHVVAPDLDGPLLLVAAVALLAASRVASARGLGASARAAAAVALGALGLATPLGGIIVLQGAVHLGELVRAQGSAPWEAAAAQKPAAAMLALAYAGVVFTLLRGRRDAPRVGAVEVLDRLAGLALAALGVAVFLGGWRLPGVDASSALGLHVLAAAVFVAKTWTLSGALRAAATLTAPWGPGEGRAFIVRRVLPALAVAAALVLAARRLTPSAAFELACGATLATTAALLLARSALRVRDALLRPEPHASPFL
jgi:NADH-quinone oxidoreductase subunit H